MSAIVIERSLTGTEYVVHTEAHVQPDFGHEERRGTMAYELKTKRNDANVDEFIGAVEPAARQEDCRVLLKLMREITKDDGAMWGGTIVGFGKYSYTYPSGHSGESCLTGFSPRKSNISIYITTGFDAYGDLLKKLGKHKTGKSCLYISKLSDIDINVLRRLINESFVAMRDSNRP